MTPNAARSPPPTAKNTPMKFRRHARKAAAAIATTPTASTARPARPGVVSKTDFPVMLIQAIDWQPPVLSIVTLKIPAPPAAKSEGGMAAAQE
ncbi:MAG: hypothetical protein IPG47_05930 [Thermoflexaceae bacterium]|nr:hypothetical protein [Thermoflexaceae bacterium]